MLERSAFKKLLGWKDIVVTGVEVSEAGLVVDIRPRGSVPICSRCGRRRARYDTRDARTWRHLDVGGFRWVVRYALRRVACARCGVVVEAVPWADVDAWHTREFEEQVAYEAQHSTKSDVVEKLRVGWATIGRIVRRVIARKGVMNRLENLQSSAWTNSR